jgi:hypothetical protein
MCFIECTIGPETGEHKTWQDNSAHMSYMVQTHKYQTMTDNISHKSHIIELMIT